MREFDAPLTVYVASDFAEGTGRLWWVALEKVIAKASSIEAPIGGIVTRLDTSTPAAKQAAFDRLHDWLRALPAEHDLQREISALCTRHDVDESRDRPRALHVLGRIEGVRGRSAGDDRRAYHHALQSGAADARRPRRSKWPPAARGSKRRCSGRCFISPIPMATGSRPARANSRSRKAAGFKTAVTTRPGMIFPESAEHLTALQRVSLNGNYQDERILPVLTSGAATAMWNGFRRIDAA